MELGLVGLPQTGKRTLFSLLTGINAHQDMGRGKDANIGISKVHDERLDRLAQMYNPKKVVPATIKYILIPDMSKNSDDNRKAFTAIQNVDAICHIVRAFDDDTVFHVDGSVSPLRDIEFLESELLLNDLIFVEGRLDKLELDIKRKNDDRAKKEKEIMLKLQSHLNEDKPLRLYEFTDDEVKIVNAYPFLSRKNIIVILNVNEDSLLDTNLVNDIQERFASRGMHTCQVSCKIESELQEIDDPQERKVFLDDLGIETSALEKITQLSYQALERLSFFTVGQDEVRAWTVRKNTPAPEAGGVVHSDIQRGFIRAEHMRVDELLAAGSAAKLKEEGKFSLKGKEYIVEDGDILHFRFNI